MKSPTDKELEDHYRRHSVLVFVETLDKNIVEWILIEQGQLPQVIAGPYNCMFYTCDKHINEIVEAFANVNIKVDIHKPSTTP